MSDTRFLRLACTVLVLSSITGTAVGIQTEAPGWAVFPVLGLAALAGQFWIRPRKRRNPPTAR